MLTKVEGITGSIEHHRQHRATLPLFIDQSQLNWHKTFASASTRLGKEEKGLGLPVEALPERDAGGGGRSGDGSQSACAG
jgi:hypothetical protein